MHLATLTDSKLLREPIPEDNFKIFAFDLAYTAGAIN